MSQLEYRGAHLVDYIKELDSLRNFVRYPTGTVDFEKKKNLC